MPCKECSGKKGSSRVSRAESMMSSRPDGTYDSILCEMIRVDLSSTLVRDYSLNEDYSALLAALISDQDIWKEFAAIGVGMIGSESGYEWFTKNFNSVIKVTKKIGDSLVGGIPHTPSEVS